MLRKNNTFRRGDVAKKQRGCCQKATHSRRHRSGMGQCGPGQLSFVVRHFNGENPPLSLTLRPGCRKTETSPRHAAGWTGRNGFTPLSFSLKGWHVTALGNAQGQRVRIHPCLLFLFEALKGRHGGSPRPSRSPGFPFAPFSALGRCPGRLRPSPSGWTNQEEGEWRKGYGGPVTLGGAQGCYVSARRAER